MPKLRTESSLYRRLESIVSSAAQEIADAVRQNIAEEVTRVVGSGGGRVVKFAKGSTALGHIRQRQQIFCPVNGCGKPGGGPKWGWFCATHKDLPQAEKDRARAESRPHLRSKQAASGRKAAKKRVN